MAFEDAVTRLNAGNLPKLWETTALISSLEYFGGEALELFPALSFEDVRLLAEAVIRSRASAHRNRIYDADDLIYVLNHAKDGLRDAELEGIESGRDRLAMLLELNRIFSRWGALQLEVQKSPAAKSGRALAFFKSIPESLAESGRTEDDSIQTVYAQIRRFLDCPLPEMLKVLFLIAAWYKVVYQKELQVLSRVRTSRASRPESRAATALRAILSNRGAFTGTLAFTAQSLIDAASFSVDARAVDRVLALWSRQTGELRRLMEEPAFSCGIDCWHLSPLHRYPIIRLAEKPPRYVVPNLRLLLHSPFSVLDYSLLDALDAEDYHAFRGSIHEEYVYRLMEWAFPEGEMLREREYVPDGKETWKGPDVTYVDGGSETLIAIEAKSRRMRPATRFQTDDESLDENLSDVHDALVRLPKKISHLRAALPAYDDFQSAIDATAAKDPILVCVLPESIHFLTQIERARAGLSTAHPLSGFPHCYCIMGLDDFEFAVALAHHGQVPLGDVLSDFWEDAGSLELDKSAADLFRGRGVPVGGLFGEQFLHQISPTSKDG